MRDYGKVSPQFWTQGTGKSLRGKPELQIVALYLMTSPHSNMIGIYHLPVMYLAHETGLTIEGASKALASLCEAEFCTYDEASETVWVHEMAKFQIGDQLSATDKRCKGVENELEKVTTPLIFKEFFDKYAKPYNLPESMALGRGFKAPRKPRAGTGAGAGAGKGSTEPLQDSMPATGFAIPLVNGSDWVVPQNDLTEWVGSYPAVDVEQELREMRAWCNANPEKRKTPAGVRKFAVRWLMKAQDTPSRNVANRASGQAQILEGAL